MNLAAVYNQKNLYNVLDYLPLPEAPVDGTLCEKIARIVNNAIIEIGRVWNYYFGDGLWHDEVSARTTLDNYITDMKSNPQTPLSQLQRDTISNIYSRLNVLKMANGSKWTEGISQYSELPLLLNQPKILHLANCLEKLRVGSKKFIVLKKRMLEDNIQDLHDLLILSSDVLISKTGEALNAIDELLESEIEEPISKDAFKDQDDAFEKAVKTRDAKYAHLYSEILKFSSYMYDRFTLFEENLELFIEGKREIVESISTQLKEKSVQLKDRAIKLQLSNGILNFLKGENPFGDALHDISKEILARSSKLVVESKDFFKRDSSFTDFSLGLKYMEVLGFPSEYVWKTWENIAVEGKYCMLPTLFSNSTSNNTTRFMTTLYVRTFCPITLELAIYNASQLQKVCMKVHNIDRSYRNSVQDSTLKIMAKTLTNLTDLEISSCCYTMINVDDTEKHNGITLKGLKALGTMTNLENLSLGSSSGSGEIFISGKLVENISNLTKLKKLHLFGSLKEYPNETQNDKNWDQLSKLTNLEDLVVCPYPFKDKQRIQPLKNSIEGLTSLRHLGVWNFSLSLDQMSSLTNFFIFLRKLDGEVPKFSKNFNINLNSIKVTSNLSTEWIRNIYELTSLKTLDLGESTVNSSDINLLQSYTHLKELKLPLLK